MTEALIVAGLAILTFLGGLFAGQLKEKKNAAERAVSVRQDKDRITSEVDDDEVVDLLIHPDDR